MQERFLVFVEDSLAINVRQIIEIKFEDDPFNKVPVPPVETAGW